MPDSSVIQARKPYVVQPRTEKLVLPYRGPISSGELNKFFDQVMNDLVTLANQGNSGALAVLSYVHTLQHETSFSRQLVLAQREQMSYLRRTLAMQGRRVGIWTDLHDGTPISFLEGSSIAKRAAVSTQFGQATVPMNAVESKTYSVSLLGNSGITSLNVIGTATGSFDKGDGVQNYEGGSETPTIEETEQKNATNGSNLEYWRRRAIFDLESDVSEVEVEATFQLPDQSNIKGNVIYVHPYPLGTVDITGLWMAPDLSDSYVAVPLFAEKEGAGKSRWFFPAQDVAKVKIRLRQRNWSEENGRKVFEYGLQELGVQLVEWDKTFDAASSNLIDNHAFVIKVSPERGMRFAKLYGFHSAPNFALEPSGNRHMHFTIAKDPNGAQVVWNSDQSSPPQSLDGPLDLGAAEALYIIVTLNWCTTVGAGSPFQAGCPPFLEGLGIDATMVESS